MNEMLEPGGGMAVVYMPVGVEGGEGIGIIATDAGSLAAMPKSVSFQVLVFEEYKTIISLFPGGSTVVRFEVAVGKVEIVTFLNTLHDITDDLPDFSLRKMGLVFDISFVYEIRQVIVAQFH